MPLRFTAGFFLVDQPDLLLIGQPLRVQFFQHGPQFGQITLRCLVTQPVRFKPAAAALDFGPCQQEPLDHSPPLRFTILDERPLDRL